MIDATRVAQELAQAKACRMAAEAAFLDVEELLWEMQRSPVVWRRLALIEGGGEPGLGVALVPTGAPMMPTALAA